MAALLEARGLVKRYGAFAAVDGIDLSLAAGEIVGLLGPNGAGKTTTVRMLTGLLRPSAGTVRVRGHDLTREPALAKRLIGYVPDEPYLYDKLTGREFVTFMGQLYGVDGDLARRVDDLLAYFDLADAADDQIGTYSHGMREKVALCGVLIHDPKVLFLDEPTVGLDPRGARLLKDTLRALARGGRAVLLCTHILEIAAAICDRVVIVERGRVVAEGSLEDLRAAARARGDESLEEIFLRLTGGEEARGRAPGRGGRCRGPGRAPG
ncbi:MAG: ABC transporter ATP-binding protein, partial [Thermomicrobiaceae bacterium]|nr:ABC transporter ATP-binding protein [Thermomicrobiaceae bacterium]